MVTHHPDKFGDHKHCDSGDIMFLICYVTTCLKVYVNLWVEANHGRSPPSHIFWPMISFKWRYKVFHLSQGVIEESCDVMCSSPLC